VYRTITDKIVTNDFTENTIELDVDTRKRIAGLLADYEVNPEDWSRFVTHWYKRHPYESISEMDRKTVRMFEIEFQLHIIGVRREMLSEEVDAFQKTYRNF